MERLRIAIPCSGLGRTRRGFERFAEELALALRDRCSVQVLAGRKPEGLPGWSVPTIPRALLERLGMSPPRAYYWEQATFVPGMAAALLATRPDVIHVSDPALANALSRLKPLLCPAGTVLFCNGGLISPKHYRRYDHTQLVLPSQVEEALAARVDENRFSQLPLGLDTSRFGGIAAGRARHELGLREGLILVSVAALDASIKRLDYVIRELATPAAGGWVLVCVGQATAETPMLRQLAQELAPGRILFRSASPREIPLYLAAADAFVLASRSEGFGLAAVEAMAAGRPVILRDIPALRYLVDDPSQLDPLEQPGALVKRLAELRSEELRLARGSRNRIRAQTTFDWTVLAPAYLELYQRVAGQPGALARIDIRE